MPASTPYPQPATRARSRAHPHAVALAIAGTDVSPSASCFPACFGKSWDRGALESAEQVREQRTGGGLAWPAPPPDQFWAKQRLWLRRATCRR